MNLIEQLQNRKVAIDKGGKIEDLEKVLDYAFPEDKYNMIWSTDRFFLADVVNNAEWTYAITLPYGMKAVDVKEFLKEMNGEDFKAKYEAEKERANKAEAKLKESQPFDRGEEGWVKIEGYEGWSIKKYEYIGILGKFHFVYNLSLGCKRVIDFTTENPHKKETVFKGDHNTAVNSVANAKLVVRHKLNFMNTYNTDGDMCSWYYTQIGDDLQAKFDDPNNNKYIKLIK